jgi:hypothetical protein
MSKVHDTADVLYTFLKGHRNQGFALQELLNATGLRSNATTVKALKLTRELAVFDGLFRPDPCPANGQRYAVTDQPDMVFDPALHLFRVAAGVKRREDEHTQYMAEHRRGLSRADRVILDIVDEFRQTQRENESIINRLIGVVVEQRRSNRNNNNEGE